MGWLALLTSSVNLTSRRIKVNVHSMGDLELRNHPLSEWIQILDLLWKQLRSDLATLYSLQRTKVNHGRNNEKVVFSSQDTKIFIKSSFCFSLSNYCHGSITALNVYFEQKPRFYFNIR